ncbi:response regulator [Paraburkholderia strydomiana]|uniref:response regulator n=1 Tax=Paraburkholderia strydomiana TaxID=1245417 RepID=UPI001BEC3BDD|nr:response regulator [Paraburkholderia strydomiana]MBT2794298.1 response regulator [Paraburkholderia strydomiana]
MCKVLLVDDDAALREALDAALTSHGHVVFTAQDGLAALRAAIDTRPDVIISDVNMPHLEGPDAVRILKALPRFRRVPVILMSGAELLVTGLAQATLRKPVVASSLVELVEVVTRSTPFPSTPPQSAPQGRTTVHDGEHKPIPAVAALGPLSCTKCAVHICRGIELMHAQATRVGRLRELGLRVQESERLYECLVNSVASLVQCLPAVASGRNEP